MRSLARRHKFCQTHPTYALKRKPTSECKDCWRAWKLKHAINARLAHAIAAVSRLYGPDEIQGSIRWSGGRSDIKGVRIDSIPRT